jgi:hypothetical protein
LRATSAFTRRKRKGRRIWGIYYSQLSIIWRNGGRGKVADNPKPH